MLLMLGTMLSHQVQAQEEQDEVKAVPNKQLRKNHVYLEGAGNTLAYLLAYDRQFSISKSSMVSFTMGGAYLPANKQHEAFNYYVLGGTYQLRRDYLIKKTKSKKKVKRSDKVGFFETGLFYVKQDPDLNESRPWMNFYLGYNLFPLESSFFFRFGALINILRPAAEREIAELPISPIPIPRFMIGYSF